MAVSDLSQRWTFAAAVLLGVLNLPTQSAAIDAPANYPSQSIRMIVPFAPAGASDFVARIIQNSMAQFLGGSIVIDNRAGAAGNIGMAEAARAPADGYTLFLGNVGTLAVNPSLFPHLHLKSDRDFVAISLVAETPDVLIANTNFPPNNVKELVEYVKSHQAQINFATPGSGSLNRLEMEVFRRDAGLEMQHVPYKGGAAPAVMDVLAGHVELMFTTLPSAIEQIRSHNVKALAVTTKERVPTLPDVPTMTELGYPNCTSSSWQGLAVPKGTPRPIVDMLYRATVHTLADPEVRRRLADGGVLPIVSKSPEEFAAFVESETARWEQVVKETGASPD
jgi:tripartite-type tricarboxylate transporter receptor subunit TctC